MLVTHKHLLKVLRKFHFRCCRSCEKLFLILLECNLKNTINILLVVGTVDLHVHHTCGRKRAILRNGVFNLISCSSFAKVEMDFNATVFWLLHGLSLYCTCVGGSHLWESWWLYGIAELSLD